jgi:hypothetical protein
MRPVRCFYEDHQMSEHFTESFFGLMEIAWLMFICLLVILTLPIWVIPFTAFKCWKSIEANRKEKQE